MLKKSDNPQLFIAIAMEYQKLDKSFSSIMATTLTDEQLARITTLTVNTNSMREFNVQSLAGIEQLTNLTHLSIRGQHSRAHAKDFSGAFERQKIYPGYDIDKDLEFYYNEYHCCQLSDEDITRLYGLTKLESIDLANQRSITEIDLSHFPNLTHLNMADCESLKTVKGMSKLKVVQDPKQLPSKFAYEESDFEFAGCYRIKDVESFMTVVENMAKNSDGVAHIHLPTAAYASLYRKHQKLGMNFKDTLAETYEHDCPVDWVETSKGNVRAVHNSRQMRMATNRIEETLRTICPDNPQGDLVRVARWYRWICDNVVYDYDNYNLEKTGTPKQVESVKHKIRSSFTTVWDKKAVCVGISNLFNYGVNLMGYTAAPVSVSGSDLETDSRAVISDHQMSALFLSQGDNPEVPIYCDPTWDLLKRDPETGRVLNPESRYFCKTYDEISTNHRFELDFYQQGQGATSIQSDLRRLGCLKTPSFNQTQAQGQ